MCLIIQGNPKKFNKEIIKKAFNQNSDGFGLMYIDKKTQRIITKKFYTKKINKIYKTFKQHGKLTDSIALHFRITTNGNTNNQNCHPFQVLNQDNDRIDVALMHNSPKLPAPLLTDNFSDTYYFSKIILRPILKSNYKLIGSKTFIDCIEKIAQAECDSRILLLDNFTNTFQFLGEWHEYKDLKYSNTNIIPYQIKYYDDDLDFNQDHRYTYNTKAIPKISVQKTPTWNTEYWNNKSDLTNDNLVSAKDLNDLSEYLKNNNTSTEIKSLCEEQSELVSDYIKAISQGYDLSDLEDCHLYIEETNKIIVDDTKPMTNQKRGN